MPTKQASDEVRHEYIIPNATLHCKARRGPDSSPVVFIQRARRTPLPRAQLFLCRVLYEDDWGRVSGEVDSLSQTASQRHVGSFVHVSGGKLSHLRKGADFLYLVENRWQSSRSWLQQSFIRTSASNIYEIVYCLESRDKQSPRHT